jgi:asparagine synthase (glutamine-hydrolysing)
MCGIVGYARPAGGTPSHEMLAAMCQALEHRGPDSRGIHTADGVGLGIQRLRIIDLATGDQPISNEDGTVTVVLNGEIYNYQELREALLARGHRFSTRSDTEVIVHLYEEHGVDCVRHLHGMFGFALWDTQRRRLLLARDRAGKKPLFYALRDGRLSFASELTALMQDESIPRDVDLEAADLYLAFRYIPSPHSIFKAVRKLPPAHTLVLDAEGCRIERYWQLDFGRRAEGSDEELQATLKEKFMTAVRRRMIADVPLGAFLSGGIDSSGVVAAMAAQSSQPVKTFSIGFDDPALDERELARLVARRFGTDHHELVVRPDAIEVIPKILRHYGEPFADATAVPTFYLARMAREHVTVALNGDGGDEAFAGYQRYAVALMAARAELVPRPLRRLAAGAASMVPPSGRINSTRSRIRRLGETLEMDAMERHLAYMTELQGLRRDALYTDEFREAIGTSPVRDVIERPWRGSSATDELHRMLDVDFQTYLADDLLAKVDIATMACSLEGRSPLLDHELLEYAASLPARLKIDRSEKKIALRRLLRGWVPDEVLDAPKRGFQPPLARWFRGDLSAFARDVLLDPQTHQRGYFRPEQLQRLLDEHVDGRADHSQGLWTLLLFELWHREHVDRRPPADAALVADG